MMKTSLFSEHLPPQLKATMDSIKKIVNDIIKKANITSILDLKTKNKNIMSLIYESKNISDSTKKMLGDFIKIIIKCLTDVKKEELKQFLSNFFKLKEKQNGIK